MNILKENAVEFFKKEIEEYTTMTKGIISKEFREFLRNKMTYYKIAIKAINNYEGDEEDLYETD